MRIKHQRLNFKLKALKEITFSPKQEKKIVQAIREAELNTSGEIRVHISRESSDNHFESAMKVFDQLGMSATKQRNGVLFHVGLKDRNFTIIGDAGIDQCAADDFWENIKNEVVSKFKKEKYVKGLVKGIQMTGIALKKHFPYQEDDQNELPNEISWD